MYIFCLAIVAKKNSSGAIVDFNHSLSSLATELYRRKEANWRVMRTFLTPLKRDRSNGGGGFTKTVFNGTCARAYFSGPNLSFQLAVAI